MIKCSRCNTLKKEHRMVLRAERANIYRNVCRDCHNERQRERYYERKEQNPFVFKHQKLSNSAKQRGIPYDLTPEFLKFLWTGFCPISGEEISFITNPSEEGRREDSAEIDRFIPERGYVKGNVTWISRRFNRKKLDSSLEELKMLIVWLENHRPLTEGSEAIEKRKNTPWNKGLKTPGSTPSGEGNPRSILTESIVKDILREYDGQRGQLATFARKYGVSPATIRKVVERKTWKHIEIQEKK